LKIHVVFSKEINCRDENGNITWAKTYIPEGVMQYSIGIVQGNAEAYRTESKISCE